MKRHLTKPFLIFILISICTGCGFHLRGHEPLPPQLHLLYLQSDDPYGAFTKQLQQTLQSIGVMLAQDSHSAPVTLQILNEGKSQQLTSQGSSGQLSTYTLYSNVSYQLLDNKGHVVQAPQTVSASRSYQVSANQILGDTTVQANLQNDMRRDLINQLLNRLRAHSTQRALNQIQ